MNLTDDASLWYNVPGWDKLGLAVPNWGNDTHTQNSAILALTNSMGRNLQGVMFEDDARSTSPPLINTLRSVHKLCVRARDLIAARAIPPTVERMTSQHSNPQPEVFRVYPCPYYYVRSPFLKPWCGYILMALTECFQHTENARALQFSTSFGGLIGQFINKVYEELAIEVLRVPATEAKTPGFTLSEEHFLKYDPDKFFTSTERIDTVPTIGDEPTEDMLKPLTDGIPVTYLPDLPRFPDSVGFGIASVAGSAVYSGKEIPHLPNGQLLVDPANVKASTAGATGEATQAESASEFLKPPGA